LADALAKLSEEDPTFRCEIDGQTGQTIISGMGELHLEIIIERLRREYGVRCRMGAPQVAYRETVTKMAIAEGAYVRELGGRRHFAIIKIELAPNQTNAGFTFHDHTSPESFPRAYVDATRIGIVNALQSGPLIGYPVVDVGVTLLAAQFHEADSSVEDFEVAANLACREALRKAAPILLEPMMRVDTYAPEEYVGSLVHDFGARRGLVQEMKFSGDGVRMITAMTPLTEMIGYATSLRSLTSGRGSFSMELDHYAQASDAVHERYLGANWRSFFLFRD
jgi:elongation factor G